MRALLAAPAGEAVLSWSPGAFLLGTAMIERAGARGDPHLGPPAKRGRRTAAELSRPAHAEEWAGLAEGAGPQEERPAEGAGSRGRSAEGAGLMGRAGRRSQARRSWGGCWDRVQFLAVVAVSSASLAVRGKGTLGETPAQSRRVKAH